MRQPGCCNRTAEACRGLLGLVVALLCSAPASSCFASPPPVPLQQHSIGPGQSKEFQVEVGEGELAHATIVPTVGRIRVSVETADQGTRLTTEIAGQPWLVRDLTVAPLGSEVITFRVEPAGTEAQERVFELGIERVAETSAIEALIAAETSHREGLELLIRPDPEAIETVLPNLAAAENHWANHGDPLRQGRVAALRGRLSILLGGTDAAAGFYKVALELADSSEDRVGQADVLYHFGLIDYGRGEVESSRERFEQSLNLANEVGSLSLQSNALNGLGLVDFKEGHIDQALDKMNQALELLRLSGDSRGASRSLTNLGVMYRRLGRADEALAAYRAALDLTEALGDTVFQSALLSNLSVFHNSRGEIREALEVLTRALEIAERTGDRGTQVSLSANLGSLYRQLGEFSRAQELHEGALDLSIEIGAPSDQARSLIELGKLAELTDRQEVAFDFYQRALAQSRAAKDLGNEGYSLQGLGRSRVASGDAEEGLGYLDQAMELQRRARLLSGLVGTLTHKGLALNALGRTEAAGEALREALERAEALVDPYQVVAAGLALADWERGRGNPTAALEHVASAATTVETLRLEVPSPDLKVSFFSENQSLYSLFLEILLENPNSEAKAQAFAVSERARARGLLDLLTEARVDVRSRISKQFLDRERSLAERKSRLQRQLIQALSATDSSSTGAEDIRAELFALDREREDLETAIRLAHPDYADMVYPEPTQLEAVQALLDQNSVFLEYALGDRASYLFVIGSDFFEVLPLPEREGIATLAVELRGLMSRPGRRHLGALKRSAAELYEAVVEPAAKYLDGKTHLIVAPDGELHYVPFEALVMSADGNYLISRWDVSYAPSASVLESLVGDDQENERTGGFLGFADPPISDELSTAATPAADPALPQRGGSWNWRALPEARAEVSSIAEVLGGAGSEAYFGDEALERTLKTHPRLGTTRYLHFATHALVDADRPANTAILMGRRSDDPEDGLLQPHEIFDFRLSAELVVLSGCETAIGRRVRGEGLLGLTRAFLYAGAESVVVSLWAVADTSTRSLMTHLYQGLEAGESRVSALARAKRRMIEGTVHSHPYYWGPFILVGRGD